ncbi:MAG: RNA polymerase sigma factor [Thermaurantimonas sp.]
MDANSENPLESASINIPLETGNQQQSDIFHWIEQLINGDIRVQEDIYKYVYRKMYPVAYRYVNNHDDAIEIFNNSMVKVFQHIKNLDEYDKVENWIKKIIINTALDFLRVSKRHRSRMQPIHDELRTLTDSASTDGMYEYDYLIKLVNMLPARKREVFMLFAIEGYSHKEIAEVMGISESNSKLLLFEARKFLQSKLKKSE